MRALPVDFCLSAGLGYPADCCDAWSCFARKSAESGRHIEVMAVSVEVASLSVRLPGLPEASSGFLTRI
jgi:hypothetical protein